MKRFLTATVRVVDNLSRWSGSILSLLIFVMIGIVLYEVVARYLFNNPTYWALEASTMVFGTYMICGQAYPLLYKEHVNMDIFYSRWSDRGKAVVDSCTFPLFIFFFGVMLWQATAYGIESVQICEHSATAWGQPLYLWKMTAVLGVLLMVLQGCSDFICNITFAITGEKFK